MSALSRLPGPAIGGLRALAGAASVRALGAALLLAAAIAALVALAPGALGPSVVQLSLAGPLRQAPHGWLETLRPSRGGPQITQDVIRLSARPLPILGGVSWGRPAGLKPVVGGPLPPAPIAGFFAPGPSGPLPIISRDGHTPFEAYQRPFHPDGRPRIALVIGGLGLNAHATQAAIETLPPDVTLSFTAYAEGLQGWIDMARAHGHEVLLETPMEPVDFPDNDPGPYALMADGSPPETVKRLEWVLSRASGYFGLSNYLGSRFLAADPAYGTFAASLRGRGLAFIDDGSAARRVGEGLPRASAERVIDDQLSHAAIDQQLLALEAGALQRGQALGEGFAYPVTLEAVARWAEGLGGRGYQLAPASALTRR